MKIHPLVPLLAIAAFTVVTTGPVHASAYSALDTFTTQMGGRNVITSGDFSTNNHVHGTVAVGDDVSLSGNAEINSHNHGTVGLRVNGDVNLSGGNNRIMAGGATIVQNASTNAGLAVQVGQITGSSGSLGLQGNGGTPKTVTTLASPDSSFIALDAAMQSANSELLGLGTGGGTLNGSRLTFTSTTTGVSVFTWDVGVSPNINEVGFNFAADSFIVVNIINSAQSVWNAGFNIVAGSDFLASHVLWNIGVDLVTFTGDQLLGSILAPDSTINSYKQLNGSIYAGSMNQYDREIHFTTPKPPSRVPDAPSSMIALIAATSLGFAAAVRARRASATSA